MGATRLIRLAHEADIKGWREAARRLDAAGIAPDRVVWSVGEGDDDLFAEDSAPLPEPETRRRVPRQLVELADRGLLHRDPDRFALFYRLLWRTRAEPELIRVASDADVARAEALAKAVRRDMHKMTAFVRFRRVAAPDGREAFVAWFEPEHHILAATAPFFARRFANMRWSILTPQASAHWDRETLTFGAGASRADAPEDDALEDAWRTYYASIFNPARLKVKAMTTEMPKKYWRNLPEAQLIAPLIRKAQTRAEAMIAAPATIPSRRISEAARPTPRALVDEEADMSEMATLAAVAVAAAHCTRCPLYRDATQTVFGEGPQDARLMFVGEQPGDQEDLAGRAFVGPAGRLFDKALAQAGIAREGVYVTNAVKHFKFEPRGKRRIHKKPDTGEVERCRWWLDHERRLVRPKLIVAMGATAARGVLGRAVTIGATRGRVLDLEDDAHALVTVHPSFLLRLPDESRRRAEYEAFVRDIETAKSFAA